MADPNSPNGPNGIYVLPFADTGHIETKFLELAYADQSTFQKLDLYLPEGQAPSGGWPLIIFVHGGAWMMCDKRDVQLNSALSFIARGFAVASVNYRLSSEATFPAPVFDVKAAIRFLRAKADDYELDSSRYCLWGLSAGGHLVSLAGMTNDVSIMEDPHMGNADQSSTVGAVVSFYGPTQLDDMDPHLVATGAGTPDHGLPDSPEARLLGGKPADHPARVIAANPETWVTASCPPFFLAHAPADPIVPVQQSIRLAGRITAIAGAGRVTLRLVENAGHATPEFEASDVVEAVHNFLMKSLAIAD